MAYGVPGLSLADSANLDAFDSLRVSQPTGGNVIASGLVSTTLDSFQGDLKTTLPVAQLDLTPTSDILSLMVETLNSSDQTYNATLTWRNLH